MKPTFLRVGVPKNTVRPPTTIRPPTEANVATLPIPQFAFYIEEPAATSHAITLPDYAVGDYVFIAMQTTNATFSTPAGWTALMGPSTFFSNNFQVIGRVMQSGDGTTVTVSIDASRAMWANVGIVQANGSDPSGAVGATAFWSGNGGDAFDPPSVTPATAGNYYVFCGIFSNNVTYSSGAEPSGYTQILENNEGSPADHLSTVAYQLVNITTTEDPGTGWGLTEGTRWGTAWTIAIPESGGDGAVAAGDHTHRLATDDITDIDVTTTAPVVGDLLRYDGTDWIPALAERFVATSATTIANTVTETSLFGSGEGSLTLPANYLRTGRTIKLRLAGQLSDTGTPNFTIRVKLGSTTICSVGPTALTGVSGVDWLLDVALTCRSAGASGSVICGGLFDYDQGTELSLTDDTAATVDTTGTLALDVTWEWGTADAANTITAQTGIVT